MADPIKVAVVYIYEGREPADSVSLHAMGATITKLNEGSGGNYLYELKSAGHVEDARGYYENGYTEVFVVAHGIAKRSYTDGEIIGTLIAEIDCAIEANLANGKFNGVYHCVPPGYITNNEIGKKIADQNGHSYQDATTNTRIESNGNVIVSSTSNGGSGGTQSDPLPSDFYADLPDNVIALNRIELESSDGVAIGQCVFIEFLNPQSPNAWDTSRTG
jgi:hypothetical protein